MTDQPEDIRESNDTNAATDNGMATYSTSMNHNVDLFFAVGSSRGKDITGLFKLALLENHDVAIRILFWARDIRGGAGERQTFRNLLLFLEQNSQLYHDILIPSQVSDPDHRARLESEKENDLLSKLIPVIPEYGRWDDLLIFKTERYQNLAFAVIEAALALGDGLCAKWMPRKGPVAVALRKHLNLSPKQYRKKLVNLTKVVETQMCAKDWDDIEFDKLPSIAGARYQKTFNKHCEESYAAFREALKTGEVTVNASTLYPYDVIRSVREGVSDVAQAQWDALPNYLGENFILPMVDLSGSMEIPISDSGSISVMDIAISLGLYLADKQSGPFKNEILTFSSKPKFVTVDEPLLKDKIVQLTNWDNVGYSTNIEAAFELLLSNAKEKRIHPNDMPKFLLVLSDMEFDQANSGGNPKAFDILRKEYAKNNYDLPTVVFWNLNAREGNVPVRYDQEGVALISGFSPSIMKTVLSADSIYPEGIMLDTIMNERYDIL